MSEFLLDEFVAKGFSTLSALLCQDQISAFRKIAEASRLDARLSIVGNELIAEAPEIVIPLVGSPRVLDALETVMGPFVQLDSVALVTVPANLRAGISWHRDLYGSVPRGSEFQRPLSVNLLIYLQDMEWRSGPLRVIPGSHREPLLMDERERKEPHSREEFVYTSSGDGVIIHNNLVHSRSQSLSGQDRMHVSVVYNLSFMKSTVDFASPSISEIFDACHSIGDYRLMRLFGGDVYGSERYNSGFVRDEVEMWGEWTDKDRRRI